MEGRRGSLSLMREARGKRKNGEATNTRNELECESIRILVVCKNALVLPLQSQCPLDISPAMLIMCRILLEQSMLHVLIEVVRSYPVGRTKIHLYQNRIDPCFLNSRIRKLFRLSNFGTRF